MKNFRNLFADKKGATAIEYGLIAALIAVAAIGAMTSLGGNLRGTFQNASDAMSGTEAGGGGNEG